MVWQAVIAAGIAYGVLKSGTLDHDETVQSTYDTLQGEVSSDTTIYADHIDDGENPRGEVDGLSKVPDIVVKSGSENNLIVEVETADSLADRRSEARKQLRDFSKRSYRRVLVMPPSQEDHDAVKQFVQTEFEELDGELYAATPEGINEYL